MPMIVFWIIYHLTYLHWSGHQGHSSIALSLCGDWKGTRKARLSQASHMHLHYSGWEITLTLLEIQTLKPFTKEVMETKIMVVHTSFRRKLHISKPTLRKHFELNRNKIIAYQNVWDATKAVLEISTARRSNQSILKEINPEYSLEELMPKLRYSGHLIERAESLEKTMMLRKTEGRRRRGWQRMPRLDSITHLTDMNLSKLWEIVEDRGASCAAVHVVTE